MTNVTRTRWFLPLVALSLGVLLFAAKWIGGSPGRGAEDGAVVAAVGLLALVFGRSETVRALRGDGADERFELIATRALAFAGLAATLAAVAGTLVRLAQGRDAGAYGQLALVIAGAFALALVVLRFRS